ncbi:DUF3592 domain-containing protein [Streptomyces sp. NPDC018019]|uniref:DUF3592 domain-containing protein n=1 Tax=Streptomyces sp. NPDC018019 TaxID=3365030 RepID=UPI003796EBBC
MGRIPEVVLRGRGIVFRLEGYVVRVVRGRTTWTVPLAAIQRVEYTGGRVRLELLGDGVEGGSFMLTTRNTVAADAFVQQLRTALTRVSTAEQRPTQVVVEVARRRRWRLPGNPQFWLFGPGLVAYLAFSSVAVNRGAEEGIGDLVGFIMVGCPWGWLLLIWGWRDVVRDALILRRRGITVSGSIRDYDLRRVSEDSVKWHPVYQFRTLEGERCVVTQAVGHARKGRTGQVDVTYDPLSPTRVRGARRRRLAVCGFLMMFFGVLSVVLMVIPLWLFVCRLLEG